MSRANNQTTGPADEGTVASRTRRQTRVRARDEEDEEKQSASPSSSHVSPAMRIYRHALESIFSMLQLKDLVQILSVSRSWSAAARSMKTIKASIERVESAHEGNGFCSLASIRRIVASPLMRHIAAIHIGDASAPGSPLNNESLRLLALYAPNLTSLWFALILTPNEPLNFPAKLETLHLRLESEYPDAAIDGVLTALAGLPSLSVLDLQLSVFKHENSVSLSLLAASGSLTDLTDRLPRRGAEAQRRADQSDSFVSGASASRFHRLDGFRRARAVSAATHHCAMARCRRRGG